MVEATAALSSCACGGGSIRRATGTKRLQLRDPYQKVAFLSLARSNQHKSEVFIGDLETGQVSIFYTLLDI